jgi:hypothetical protein
VAANGRGPTSSGSPVGHRALRPLGKIAEGIEAKTDGGASMADQPKRPTNWMWRHQSDFLSYSQASFAEILEELGCELEHHVHLVGFQTDQMSGIPTVRVDPEANGFPVVELAEMFDGIKDRYAPYPDDDLSEDDWKTAYRKHDYFCSDLNVGIRDVLKARFDSEKCCASAPCHPRSRTISSRSACSCPVRITKRSRI